MAVLKNIVDTSAVGAILCKKIKNIHRLVLRPYAKKEMTSNLFGFLYNTYPLITILKIAPIMYCRE